MWRFLESRLAPRANSSLFVVLVPLMLAIYLGSLEDQSGAYRLDGGAKQKYSREMEKSSETKKGNIRNT